MVKQLFDQGPQCSETIVQFDISIIFIIFIILSH